MSRTAQPSLYRRARRQLKSLLARTLWAYDGAALAAALRRLGVKPGDTLMVHASWLADNGFTPSGKGGGPAAFVAALQQAVGPDGLLVMPTMTYHDESSASFLARGAVMDVRRSASRMGLLSEVFRRARGVERSLSPTHPLAAWGRDAGAFLAGHEATPASFGPDSPFARLVARDARILLVDAPFSTITFTHFLEDRIRHSLAMPFYEAAPVPGQVVDSQGNRLTVPTLVITEAANAARREPRLVAALEHAGAIRRARVGNTSLAVIDAQAMVDTIDRMVAAGDSFFADGRAIT
jgi:aminoglycoside 3-N-acetyltransferase